MAKFWRLADLMLTVENEEGWGSIRQFSLAGFCPQTLAASGIPDAWTGILALGCRVLLALLSRVTIDINIPSIGDYFSLHFSFV